MRLLSVRNICKHYPTFSLEDVSFEVDEGCIMGFIGRNGAGKTTTLKSVMGLVKPDSGAVEMFGKEFADNEFECKQDIGFVLGEVDYYPTKKLSTIASVTRRFYKNWDEAEFERYMKDFGLDSNKRVKELSAGMKVKFSLALALSHKAKLLILDEPTSGLDPVSRDELIGIFIDLVSDGKHSILFSTHIITDLEKCADYITYIKEGRILASTEKDAFADRYRSITGDKNQLTDSLKEKLIGCREHDFGFEAVIRTEDERLFGGFEVGRAGLEDIMVHIERE